MRSAAAYEKTMERFDVVVGRTSLRAAHINDAKVEFGSRKDRHESLGRGRLGMEAFRLLMNDPRFDDLPLILETIDDTLWAAEIKLLYSLIA
jgi:deoxyribonuclease-4